MGKGSLVVLLWARKGTKSTSPKAESWDMSTLSCVWMDREVDMEAQAGGDSGSSTTSLLPTLVSPSLGRAAGS